MSFLALAAAADLPRPELLTNVERLVLFGLAHHHNRRSGLCYPSQTTIATRMNIAERSVFSALQALADKEMIVVLKGKGGWSGGRRSDAYRLVFAEAYARANPGVAAALKAAEVAAMVAGKGGGDFPATIAGIEAGDFPAKSADFLAATAREPGTNLDNPRKAPKGASPEAIKLAEEIWAETPAAGRKRSGQADLAKACNRVLGDGVTAEQLRAALRCYYADPDIQRDDLKFAKGVHLMVQQDRWREWIPEDDEDAPGAEAEKVYPPEVMAAHLDRVWTSRMEDLTGIGRWDRHGWGPKPGEPGCAVPPHILEAFGAAP